VHFLVGHDRPPTISQSINTTIFLVPQNITETSHDPRNDPSSEAELYVVNVQLHLSSVTHHDLKTYGEVEV
jgi:hypothetical protein